MNDWDTIEKMINTLPQWDIIKWIMGIQEELKCAKEDNLYQLRQNKNLQSKIDKAIKMLGKYKHLSSPTEEQANEQEEIVSNAYDILKEDK